MFPTLPELFTVLVFVQGYGLNPSFWRLVSVGHSGGEVAGLLTVWRGERLRARSLRRSLQAIATSCARREDDPGELHSAVLPFMGPRRAMPPTSDNHHLPSHRRHHYTA